VVATLRPARRYERQSDGDNPKQRDGDQHAAERSRAQLVVAQLVVQRIAHEVGARNASPGDLELVGLATQGPLELADALAKLLFALALILAGQLLAAP
jgi:hypothetical protein